MCVSDCTDVDGNGVAGRYSAADVEAYIKKPAYYRTAKDYHPNIDQTIDMATNIEAAYLEKAEADNLPIYAYQIEQNTEMIEIRLDDDDEEDDGDDTVTSEDL